jgi:hypothetical protein
MAFLAYIAVMIVAVGSVLFGVELITAPPPQKPLVHIANAPNKLAQREADRRAEENKGDTDKALTPLYPTSPGSTKDVRVVYPPSDQTQPTAHETSGEATEPKTGAKTDTKTAGNNAPSEPQTNPPPAQAAQPAQTNVSAAPQLAPKPHAAKAEEPPAQKPAQAAVDHAADHCEVQACASAYASFRAADCSYQPYDGPRRMCTKPPQQRSAERDRPRDMPATRVMRMDPGTESRTVEPTGPYADDDDEDAGAPPAGGERMIVIERAYRPRP